MLAAGLIRESCKRTSLSLAWASGHPRQRRPRSWSGRAAELHRGGAALLLVTFSEVALRNVVLRRASSHDVCDLYIRMAPEPHARSLPLRTIRGSAGPDYRILRMRKLANSVQPIRP